MAPTATPVILSARSCRWKSVAALTYERSRMAQRQYSAYNGPN